MIATLPEILTKGSALVVTAAGRLVEAIPSGVYDPFSRVSVMRMEGQRGRGYWKEVDERDECSVGKLIPDHCYRSVVVVSAST